MIERMNDTEAEERELLVCDCRARVLLLGGGDLLCRRVYSLTFFAFGRSMPFLAWW